MNYEPVQIRELQWLARYYEMHGHRKEAREIRKALAEHDVANENNDEADQSAEKEDK